MVGTNGGETEFKKWLDQRGYAYLYIDQSTKTFSEFFRGVTKRPDFLVAIPKIGMIAVDIKEKKSLFEKHNSKNFTLDEQQEVNKYLAFERLLRIPVWFVFYLDGNYSHQYWVPLTKVLECELESSTNGEFRIIKLEDCIILQANIDGISRIID